MNSGIFSFFWLFWRFLYLLFIYKIVFIIRGSEIPTSPVSTLSLIQCWLLLTAWPWVCDNFKSCTSKIWTGVQIRAAQQSLYIAFSSILSSQQIVQIQNPKQFLQDKRSSDRKERNSFSEFLCIFVSFALTWFLCWN